MTILGDHVSVFRTHWATRFVDTCDAVRLSSRGSMNATTLQYPSESEPNVMTGQACLYRPAQGEPVVAEFGQQGVSRIGGDFLFPHDAPELKVEDTITYVTSADSPKLVGKIFRVTGVHFDAYQTHMIVEVELEQGPGETNEQ